MLQSIKCAGFGGQGVLTAGLILANVAMDHNMEVTWSPSYGSEMRGGLATCNIRMGDERIGTPFVNRDADLVLAMNGNAVNLYEKTLRPGGLLVVNSNLLPENHVFRTDIRVVSIAGNDLTQQAKAPRGFNVLMIAAAVAAAKLFTKEQFQAGAAAYFNKKGKNNPQNALCIDLGWDAAVQAGA